jgi:2,4-didehydro-3-deoxy-L-rhamnonate hydrolase
MRLVTWELRGAPESAAGRMPRHAPESVAGRMPRLGVLLDGDPMGRGGRVLDLADLPGLGAIAPIRRAIDEGDLVRLLAVDPGLRDVRAACENAADAAARAVPRSEARLLAPLLRPGKIVCIGLNYRDHVEEHKLEVPDRPILFAKFANTVVADGDPVIHHDATHALDLEAELCVVIGSRARRVSAADAMRYVAGYTAANDVSARDLQGAKPALRPGEHGDGQWLRAKGSDTFLPLGPALVTADEVDAARCHVRSWVLSAGTGPERAGEAAALHSMQAGTTADMIFDVPYLVEFVSAVITLEPGDLIITGTPSGVGVFRTTPVFVQPGDVMIVEIGGVGHLENPVVAADGTAPVGTPAARLIESGA